MSAAAIVRSRTDRPCGACGALINQGDPHMSWAWFYEREIGRAHVHALCHRASSVYGDPLGDPLGWGSEDRLDPKTGHNDWAQLVKYAPAAWRDGWAQQTFHPAVLNTWLIRVLTGLDWSNAPLEITA